MITFLAVTPPAPPTVYLDFPPNMLVTISVVIFVATFHLLCFQLIRVIFL
jgi:hypothetical protein